MAPDVWSHLMTDFRAGPRPGGEPGTYRPLVSLRLGAERRGDVWIRLKGDSSWRAALTLDADPKAQFVVSFGEGEAARSELFHGVRKIGFDMPRSDPTLLNERVAYAFMRAAGLPAPCANSAELYINGQLYGLFTAEEHPDSLMLDRLFPGASSGVLLKSGREIAANRRAYDVARAGRVWAARDVAAMQQAGVDLSDSLSTWAAEAIVNDADGYWGGDHNFYLYDDPRRGWRWLTDDADLAFAWTGIMQHPIYWWVGRDSAPPAIPQHYLAVVRDAPTRARFVSEIERLVGAVDVAAVQRWIDEWSAQIDAAAARDPHLPISAAEHRVAVANLRAEVSERAQYLRAFVACEARGGEDRDGDGAPWCRDCDDARPDVHPGAAEICGDGVDQDCDGVADGGCDSGR